MAYESMFSASQIAALLPSVIETLCPFELTQYGNKFQIYYKAEDSKNVRVKGYDQRFPFGSVGAWLERGDLIDGKPFNDWYNEHFGIHADDVEALL
jgi:hypothetical protein